MQFYQPSFIHIGIILRIKVGRWTVMIIITGVSIFVRDTLRMYIYL
jgi:hypothetical protein